MRFQEVVGSIYPWDIADEGVEAILDNLQEKAGVNFVYLIAVEIGHKRPLTDFYFPHNPRRKVMFVEDGRAYFQPHPEFYRETRMKPNRPTQDFLKNTDWLEVLVTAARKRGLKVGAEFSHGWHDKEQAVAEFPDALQRDVFGNLLPRHLCFNSPDARRYALGLFADVATNYEVDMLQTCVYFFHPGQQTPPGGSADAQRLLAVTTGGCFCQHCERAARAQGLDWDALQRRVREIASLVTQPTLAQAHERALLLGSDATAVALLLEWDELRQWLQFRCDSITGFLKEAHETVQRANPQTEFRLNHYERFPEMYGLDLRRARSHLDSIRNSDYSEQSGEAAQMEGKRQRFLRTRRAVGEEMKFVGAIGIRPKATPELIRLGVRIAAECGCDGISLGHYEGATMPCLAAIKVGLEEAGVTVG